VSSSFAPFLLKIKIPGAIMPRGFYLLFFILALLPREGRSFLNIKNSMECRQLSILFGFSLTRVPRQVFWLSRSLSAFPFHKNSGILPAKTIIP